MSGRPEARKEERVVLVRAEAGDGWGTPPFDAAAPFPETGGAPLGDNTLYGAVRQALAGLGLDADRHGKPDWNPLRDLVGPGGRVVLKPNMVRHRHGTDGPLEAVVTDPRVTRAVLDYAVAAVTPGGEVAVADSPLQSCDFEALAARIGLRQLAAAAERNGVRVRVLDYRREEVSKAADGLIQRRTPLAGDPQGYVVVDLGGESALGELFSAEPRFRVTQYDRETTSRHHCGQRHEFLIPRSLLTADLVISLPKIKTHRKAGMTGALKNLVGINGSKAWLPHHRAGSVSEGGDEYLHPSARKRWITRLWEKMDRTPSLPTRRLLDRVARWLYDSGRFLPFPDPYFEGSWWGNTTLPAMVTDLNRIFLYVDGEGRLAERPVRNVLVLADAVVAGEGEGPLEPTARHLGLLIGGRSALAVDWVAATLMGFDPLLIPTLSRAARSEPRPLAPFPPGQIVVSTPQGERSLDELAAAVERPFVPPSGWRGRIESERSRLRRAG